MRRLASKFRPKIDSSRFAAASRPPVSDDIPEGPGQRGGSQKILENLQMNENPITAPQWSAAASNSRISSRRSFMEHLHLPHADAAAAACCAPLPQAVSYTSCLQYSGPSLPRCVDPGSTLCRKRQVPSVDPTSSLCTRCCQGRDASDPPAPPWKVVDNDPTVCLSRGHYALGVPEEFSFIRKKLRIV